MYLFFTRIRPALSLLLFLVIFGCLAALLAKISHVHPQFKYYQLPSAQTALTKKPTIEAITIGSSHSGGVDFDTIEKAGEYMNITGADVFEASYTVNQFLQKQSSLNTVYMAIAYPLLRLDNAKTRPAARIRNYYLLPRPYLPCSKLINFDISNCLKAWALPITRYDNWESIIAPNSSVSRLKAPSRDRKSNRGVFTKTQIQKRAKHHLKLAKRGSTKIQNDAKKHLENTIQTLKKQGINIVFFTPPYHPDYVSSISTKNSNLIKNTHSIMNELSKKYDVFYKDYNSLAFPLNGFKNPDHLNEQGSKLFSNYLKKDVEQFIQTRL